MTQLMYPRDQAHEAIDAFLADPDTDRGPGDYWVAAEDGKHAAAFIVNPERFHRMQHGYSAWLDSQEVHDDPELPPGYRPWIHSPLATTERLLPTEPLQEPLAHFMFEKKWDELESKEQHQVTYAAICCLLRVTLDPDGQGAVPILAVDHQPDEPGNGMRWQIAFTTPVPGLFVRVTGNGFIGEEWAILTGSGWIIHNGYAARELATTAAEALGRTLPNCDWMRLVPDNFTPAARKAIIAVLRRHAQWGEDDAQPEPEVMPDRVPAGGELAGAPAGEDPTGVGAFIDQHDGVI